MNGRGLALIEMPRGLRHFLRMLKATIGEAQHNLSKLIRAVGEGEEVIITRRDRVVARLVPAHEERPDEYPEFSQRARALFGPESGTAASRLVDDDRSERL